jgi:hypothetical protein
MCWVGRAPPTRQQTRPRCRVDWNAAGGSRWGRKGLWPYLGGLLSHPVLQGTAAPTGAGPRVEGSRWGGGGPQALGAMFDLNKIRSLELSKDASCDCFTDVGGGYLGLS